VPAPNVSEILQFGGKSYIYKESWWGLKYEYTPLKVIRSEWHFKNSKGKWQELLFDEKLPVAPDYDYDPL